MRSRNILLAVLVLALPCFASHRRSHRTAGQHGQAGVFDFYVLALSWSPEFCYSRPDAAECGKHAGFVVHGLWPQNSDGTFPLSCATDQAPPTTTEAVSEIMPAEIIQHEWQKHGTCSGLSGDAYFALVRRAYETVKIPAEMRAPSSSFTTAPRQLKAAFEHANPSLQEPDIAIQLRRKYLNSVEICLTKSQNPAPMACSGLRDASGGTLIVPPVR